MNKGYLKRQYDIINEILSENNVYLTDAESYIEITLKHISNSSDEYKNIITNLIKDKVLEKNIHFNIRLKANDRKHETIKSKYFNDEFSIKQALNVLKILDEYLEYIDKNYKLDFVYKKFMNIYKKESPLNIVEKERIKKESPLIKKKEEIVEESPLNIVEKERIKKESPLIKKKEEIVEESPLNIVEKERIKKELNNSSKVNIRRKEYFKERWNYKYLLVLIIFGAIAVLGTTFLYFFLGPTLVGLLNILKIIDYNFFTNARLIIIISISNSIILIIGEIYTYFKIVYGNKAINESNINSSFPYSQCATVSSIFMIIFVIISSNLAINDIHITNIQKTKACTIITIESANYININIDKITYANKELYYKGKSGNSSIVESQHIEGLEKMRLICELDKIETNTILVSQEKTHLENNSNNITYFFSYKIYLEKNKKYDLVFEGDIAGELIINGKVIEIK